MPAYLATLGLAAAWLGLIEGVADGAASFAKLGSGFYTDGLQRRKPIAVVGYLMTALGTGAFAFATTAWHLLAARSFAWLGRGVRTPVRKALLAASVPREAYSRAFGLERAMDTVGAIVGPLTALLLLRATHGNYRLLFMWTLLPGLAAAAVIALLVKERTRAAVPHVSFGERLRSLPKHYRRFVGAVAVFGAGDFAHSLLILLATQKLAPSLGVTKAAGVAVALYILHNVFYALFSLAAGWLGDRMPRHVLLAVGYGVAVVMTLCIILLPPTIWTMALVFVTGGIQMAFVETTEDSLCADLTDPAHHGTAFGVLATVNGLGDFVSSIVVGLLWTAFGVMTAFSFSAVLFFLGALLIFRLAPNRGSIPDKCKP